MKLNSHSIRSLIASPLLMLTLAGCGIRNRDGQKAKPALVDGDRVAAEPWFEDVAVELGVDFRHVSGDPSDYFMPKNMGSGAAFFDADNDGKLDVFCVQHGQPPFSSTSRFFRQQPDGSFVDLTEESGLGLKARGAGVAAGDVNNDGRTDLLLTSFGQARLMLNRGQCRFEDVSEESGIDNPLWGTSAAFADFDRDGWLDVVIANYLAYSGSRTCFDSLGHRDFCSPHSFGGTPSRLFRNVTGDSFANDAKTTQPVTLPAFVDITVSSGLANKAAPALGVICADFDGDHWQDILVANDGQPNHLWINRHDGTFEEQAALRGLAFSAMGRPYADMGIAYGDVDRNGLLDVYITHLTNEFHSLWMQRSPGIFADATAQYGLTRPVWRSTGFGVGFADFNHDGWLDLAQVNGRVRRQGIAQSNAGQSALSDAGHTADSSKGTRAAGVFWQPYLERNQLFAGQEGGIFTDISPSNSALCGKPNLGRGLACGDFDNDGDVDLLLTAIDAPAGLLRNVAPKQGHWLSIQAVLPSCGGRDAIGATVTLQAGDESRVAWIQPASSYQSSGDPRGHFGLGSLDTIDHIDVRWPDGTLERFPGGKVDQQIVLQCGSGTLFDSSLKQ